ncbi:MAG TPA: hypothetical protein VJN94_03440 [Candidatus Binataceae bacterium]|nr:hypothetical protein [Candidatus Binataceae bacterium]
MAQESPVTAIDIVLEPDATMVHHAEAVNARLRSVFPKGFALDATHHPHISMLQRFVRTADLDKIYAAADKVFMSYNVTSFKLKAYKYYYLTAPSLPGVGLSGIVVETTPELVKLQQDLIDAVAPYTVKTGTAAAFVTTPAAPDINEATIRYIEAYVPEHSGEHLELHVTTGLASVGYLNEMLAEPFEDFTFSPSGASVFHLGNYGTAAAKLKDLDVK